MKKKYISPNIYIDKDFVCGNIIAASIKFNKKEEADWDDYDILTKQRSNHYFYSGFCED